MLVSDILKASMRVAQVLRQGEDPTTTELTDALQVMTIMLQSWAARRLLTRANTVEPFTVTDGMGSYLIGSGMAFNTSKPNAIMKSYIRDSNNYDTDVEVWSMEQYNSLPDKYDTEGRPSILAYDPGYAQQSSNRGTVYLYLVPDQTYTLYLNQQKVFTEYTAVTETMTFENMYNEAIKYELARRLWREYHSTPVPEDVEQDALKAMTVVENANSPRVIADLSSVGGTGSSGYSVNLGGTQ